LSTAEARIAQLEAENAALKQDATAASEEVERWRTWSASLFNALLLSPESCEGRRTCKHTHNPIEHSFSMAPH
jgi:hypothetical protein